MLTPPARELLTGYQAWQATEATEATDDDLYELIGKVNEVHKTLRGDTCSVGPVSLPDGLRYVELNWDHWLRVFAHEAGVPVWLSSPGPTAASTAGRTRRPR
ncbi:hypothetical protein [Streptomyces sp. NBC_01176]|uniref:hypothetical protein n=1 Tax=Streptomyces sp. NBC_01176 TaxID=2903760 RepID=UPI002F90E1EA|nr:hypothetical protein OG199_44975 [Streptomyces sp. NBC_01176]